jgi:hypothetical protein
MSEQIVLTVLNEVLEELKEANKSLKEMGGTVKALELRVDTGMQHQIVAQCEGLRRETAAGMLRIAAVVEAQPKPIVRRISLFPENDKEGNYKTFIRWLIGGTIGAMMVLTAYVLINEQIQRTYPRETQAAVSGSNLGMQPAPPPPISTAAGAAGKARKAGFRQHSKKTAKKIDTLEQNVIQTEMDSVGRNQAKD